MAGCTTIASLNAPSGVKFGVDATLETPLGEYIQNLKLTAKADKQEIRGSCGTVRAVVFSKKTLDIEYTHYGIPKSSESIGEGGTITAFGPGDTIKTIATDFISGVGSIYIEEVTTEQSNSEATKTTVKAVGYKTS
jgi:hypothetical protein